MTQSSEPSGQQLTRFSVEQVAALLGRARSVVEYSAEGLEGWTLSDADPEKILAAFAPALRIKPGTALRGYQYRAGGNGNGIVYAVPRDTLLPDCFVMGIDRYDLYTPPPPPSDALESVMHAVEGDGSAWSYLCASLLVRELGEFGAIWHGVSWGTHSLHPDSELEPVVSVEDGRATVTFHTSSGLDQERVFRHVDVYTLGSVCGVTRDEVISAESAGYLY